MKTVKQKEETILPQILQFADRVNSFARSTLNKELNEHGVKFNQWKLINTIYTKSVYTPAKIADELMIERATVSRYLDQLEECGCLERTHDSYDRRVVNIILTNKGEKLAQLGISLMDTAHDEFFTDLSSTEYKNLSELLEKISNNISNQDKLNIL